MEYESNEFDDSDSVTLYEYVVICCFVTLIGIALKFAWDWLPDLLAGVL